MTKFQLHPQLAKDGIVVGDFDLSLLLMINDAAYPWFVLVPKVPDIQDAHQLDEETHLQLTLESRLLAKSLLSAFGGKKLNIAALGNMVPQLHIHHIVRYETDAAWPAPIWGKQDLTPMTAADIAKRISKLRALKPTGLKFR